MRIISLDELPAHQGLIGHFWECVGRALAIITDFFPTREKPVS